MPRLTYVGPDPAVNGVVPLPEGWPAMDHDEPDSDIAAAKLAQRVKIGSRTREDGTTEWIWGEHVYALAEQPKDGKAKPAAQTAKE